MHLFTIIRLWTYAAIITSSTVVLGLSSSLASKFLPDLHRDFTIFSLVASSLTIVVLILLLMRSQPIVDVIFAFILGVIWLTMGGWSVDNIGGIQCDALDGVVIPIKNGQRMSYRTYCREMKVIEAFSWGNFCFFAIAFGILIALTTRAQTLGRHQAWNRSITDLPWFGEWIDPSYNNGQPYNYPAGGYVIHQQPGHSVLIQRGEGGQPPNIQQVPGTVVSA